MSGRLETGQPDNAYDFHYYPAREAAESSEVVNAVSYVFSNSFGNNPPWWASLKSLPSHYAHYEPPRCHSERSACPEVPLSLEGP